MMLNTHDDGLLKPFYVTPDILISSLFELGHDAKGIHTLSAYLAQQSGLGYGTLLALGHFTKVGNEYVFAVISQSTKIAASGQVGPNAFTSDFEISEDGVGLEEMAAWMNDQVASGASILHELKTLELDGGYVRAIVIMSDGQVLTGTVPQYVEGGTF